MKTLVWLVAVAGLILLVATACNGAETAQLEATIAAQATTLAGLEGAPQTPLPTGARTPTISVLLTPTAVPTLAPVISKTPVATGDYIVYITRTGAKYHRDGCRYLSKSKIPILKSEAIRQSYTPCSVCSP